MFAGWVFAATVLVRVINCMATNESRIIAVSTPPAYSVSPYYNYWDNGSLYYNPTILAPKPTLSIAFVNESIRVIKEVEFAVFSGDTLVMKVRDSGHFAPGVTIDHALRLRADVFPLPSGPIRCVALSAT